MSISADRSAETPVPTIAAARPSDGWRTVIRRWSPATASARSVVARADPPAPAAATDPLDIVASDELSLDEVAAAWASPAWWRTSRLPASPRRFDAALAAATALHLQGAADVDPSSVLGRGAHVVDPSAEQWGTAAQATPTVRAAAELATALCRPVGFVDTCAGEHPTCALVTPMGPPTASRLLWIDVTSDDPVLPPAVHVLAAAAAVLGAATLHERAQSERELAAAAERDRLCQVLHDDAQQVLTSLAVRIECGTAPPDAICDEMRALATRLRLATDHLDGWATGSTPLDRRRFAAELRSMAADAAGEVPVHLHLDVDRGLSVRAGLAVRRVVLQAVANARQHSHASEIRVLVRSDGEQISAEITDDGVGIPDDYVRAGRPGHVGLASMRLWATRAGGTCEISRLASGGTRVAVAVPLSTR